MSATIVAIRVAEAAGAASDPPRDPARNSCAVRPSLSASRPTSTSRAPIRANDPAASRPRPDVGPVMTTVRPAIDQDSAASQSKSRRRIA